MCCKCCHLKLAALIFGILGIINGVGILVLGIAFPSIASTTQGNETILCMGFCCFGVYFIAISIFGLWITHENRRWCMIFFLVLIIAAAFMFLGYGGYVITQLGSHQLPF